MTRLSLVLLLALACDRGPRPDGNTGAAAEESSMEATPAEPPAEVEAPTRPAPTRPARPSTVSAEAPELAGVRWSVHEPLTWRPPSRPMRNAEYIVGEGDTQAVMTVFHFPGMGGSVEENVQRWTGQFSGGEPTVSTRTVGGLDVTTIDVTGTFTNAMPMGGAAGPQENQRLLGAIVAGPNGPIFFKLLGPASTVSTASEAFNDLVDSFTAG
ncbi:MAG: hypothetical protein AAF411_27400 [Myxococcota bacterium]